MKYIILIYIFHCWFYIINIHWLLRIIPYIDLNPMFKYILRCISFPIYGIFYLWHNVLFLQAYNIRSYGNLIWNRYNMSKNATEISHWFISMLTRSEKLSYIVNVNEPQPGFQGLIECIPNTIVGAIYLVKCMWRWPEFIMDVCMKLMIKDG